MTNFKHNLDKIMNFLFAEADKPENWKVEEKRGRPELIFRHNSLLIVYITTNRIETPNTASTEYTIKIGTGEGEPYELDRDDKEHEKYNLVVNKFKSLGQRINAHKQDQHLVSLTQPVVDIIDSWNKAQAKKDEVKRDFDDLFNPKKKDPFEFHEIYRVGDPPYNTPIVRGTWADDGSVELDTSADHRAV